MPAWRAPTSARALVALTVAGWLAVGLLAAFTYVHRYIVYRGFPTPTTPTGVSRGTLREVTFHSPAIGQDNHYLAYLPPGYAAGAARGRRFPVLYLLHGTPGQMGVFTNVGAIDVRANVLIARHAIPPMILVMPEGEPGTLHGDTEWANTAAGRWMDFVMNVVHDVDHRFATKADRQHRGIAGDSEGAYGAVNVGLRHLPEFSVIESWSGYFTQTPTGVFSHASPAELRANSPAGYVASLASSIRRLGLRTWLLQGRTDPTDPRLIRNFSAQLHAAGADVRYGFFAGGHDWGLWRAQAPHMLRVAGRWFSQRPGAHVGFGHVGRSLPYARLQRILAARRRRCLALRPGSGVRIGRVCRARRLRHRLPVWRAGGRSP